MPEAPDPRAASDAAADDATRRVVPLTGLRGAVARNTTLGWQAPQVAMSVEADVTRCESRRAALQESVGAAQKVTLTAFILRAVALTLKEHPRMNALLKEHGVELVEDINLAFAVSLDEGLLAPVIRNADRKTVAELARESRELAEAARAFKLGPGAYQRGTFTVTNLGMTGIDWFTPVINPPQIGILGVTRVTQKPIVRDGAIAVAPMMGLHLVFDHRAIDGYPAAVFLDALRKRIETAEDL